MTQDKGPGIAKSFGDAHERDPEPEGERLMDLYNNAVGRLLAIEPWNNGRDPVEVVKQAIDSGIVMTQPVMIQGDSGEETGGYSKSGGYNSLPDKPGRPDKP